MTHNHETVLRLEIALLGVGVVILLGLLGREIAGERAGLLAAGLGAVYPYLWVNDGLILAETFAALGTVATIYFTYRLVRGRAGATRSRPACRARSRCSAARSSRCSYRCSSSPRCSSRGDRGAAARVLAGVVCLAAAIPVVPWVVHDLMRFEEPVFLSYGAGSVLQGANCDQTYGGERLGYWDGTCNALTDTAGDGSVESGRRRDLAFDYMGDHLDRLPVVVAARVGRLWGVFRPIETARDNQFEGRPMWASVAGLVMFVPLAAFAAAGLVILRRRRVPLIPLVAPIVIVTLMAAMFYGLIRFRVPAEVSLVVLAAVALDALVARRYDREPQAVHTDPQVDEVARAAEAPEAVAP